MSTAEVAEAMALAGCRALEADDSDGVFEAANAAVEGVAVGTECGGPGS